jgi:hypothetical protein
MNSNFFIKDGFRDKNKRGYCRVSLHHVKGDLHRSEILQGPVHRIIAATAVAAMIPVNIPLPPRFGLMWRGM